MAYVVVSTPKPYFNYIQLEVCSENIRKMRYKNKLNFTTVPLVPRLVSHYRIFRRPQMASELGSEDAESLLTFVATSKKNDFLITTQPAF